MNRFLFLFIWIAALQVAFAEAPPVRIAVVSDDADKDLAALVTTEFSATPGITLLERDALSKIGDELKLQQMAGSDPAALGKLLGTDGLLFLNKGAAGLQIRFTAVGLGFALFEDHPPDEVKQPELAKSIAHRVIGYAPKLKLDPGVVIPISILNLHSEYATPQSTELEQKLTILLENRLMELPDFIVLERRHAWSLAFEHSLIENPKPFLRGEYILEGSLSQPLQNPPSADVQARLQLRSANQEQKSINGDGSINQLPAFVDQLALQIQKCVGGTNAIAFTDSGESQKEAREYLKEGIWAMQHGASEAALPALDSAALLGETAPDLVAARIRMLLWRAAQELIEYSAQTKTGTADISVLEKSDDDAQEALTNVILYWKGDMEKKLQLLDIHMDASNRTWVLMNATTGFISKLLVAMDDAKAPRAEELRQALRSITDYDPLHGKLGRPGFVQTVNSYNLREVFADEWASTLEEELAYYHLLFSSKNDAFPFGRFPGKFCHRFINNTEEERKTCDQFVQDMQKDPATRISALIFLSNSTNEAVAEGAYKEYLSECWNHRDEIAQEKWYNTQFIPPTLSNKYGAEAIPLLHYYLTHPTPAATARWRRYFDLLWHPDSWTEADAKTLWAEYLSAKRHYINLGHWCEDYEAPVLKKFPQLTLPVPIENRLTGDAIIVNLLWTPWGPPGNPKAWFLIISSDAIGDYLYLFGPSGLYKISLPDKKIEAIPTPERILQGGIQVSQNTLYLDYEPYNRPSSARTRCLAIYDVNSKTWSRKIPPFVFQGTSLLGNSVFASMPRNEGLFRYEWDSGKTTLLYSIRRKPALNQFDDHLFGQVAGVALGPGGRPCTLVGGVFYIQDKPGNWPEVFHSNASPILSNHVGDKTLLWSQEGEVVLLDPSLPEPEFLVGGKKRKFLKVLPMDKNGVCNIDPNQPETPWDAPKLPDNPHAQPFKGVGMHNGRLFVMEMASGNPYCYHLLVYSHEFGRTPRKIPLWFNMNGAFPFDPASSNGKPIDGLPSVNFLTCDQGFCFVGYSGGWFLPFKDIDTFLKAHPSAE